MKLFRLISLALIVLGDFLIAVPVVAMINKAYDGDQALLWVLGLLVSLPGLIFAIFDLIRNGRTTAKISLVSLILFLVPLATILVIGLMG